MEQDLPHAPQFPPSLVRFTHLPAQFVRPGGHALAQAPAVHVWPPVQCVAQPPQNCGSVCAFTQASPLGEEHASGVAPVQVAPQVLDAHVGVPVPAIGLGQTLAQAPQLLGSVASSTQPAGQWSGKPEAWQVKPQLDIEQTGVPFVADGHAMSHVPQLSTSEVVSMQADPHLVKPASQTKPHVAPLHVGVPLAGAEQAMPHIPQLAGSSCSSTQASLQALKPASQTKPQIDEEQIAVPFAGGAHTLVHVPQLCVSLVVSTQLPPQFVWPIGQERTQAPPAQSWFIPHAMPQAPQLFLSEDVLTHAPTQAEKPALQEMPHWPFWQVGAPFWGVGHALAQAPQLATSVASSTQAEPHLTNPVLQVKPQVLLLHVGVPWLGAWQTSPQLPQLEVSVCSTTQDPPQFVVPVGQVVVQRPAAQTWSVPQAIAHMPQLFVSDCSSTQVPLQSV